MNETARRVRGRSRRRLRYVDAALQRWILIVAALEAAAVALSVAALYWRLDGLISASLFRVHMTPGPSMASVLLGEGLTLLALFVAANLAALVLATWIWGRRVGGLLRRFAALSRRSAKLDFAADPGTRPHEVLELAARWREAERTRLVAIRAELEAIDPARPDAAGTADALKRIDGLLR